MQDTTLHEGPAQLVIRPTPRSLACAYGLLTVFGTLALFHSVGVCFLLHNVPADFAWWEKAVIVGLPVAFALALAWWVLDSRRPLRLDRAGGLLFDGDRPVLRLASVQAVTVNKEPGDTADFYVVELIQDTGKT